jgi:hypothetical protein
MADLRERGRLRNFAQDAETAKPVSASIQDHRIEVKMAFS